MSENIIQINKNIKNQEDTNSLDLFDNEIIGQVLSSNPFVLTKHWIKLRKHVEQVDDGSEDDEEIGDDFESMYKGEISKSGTPILPSKRARKTPEKIQVSQEDLAELSETAKPDVEVVENEETMNDQGEVSLDEVSECSNT